MSSADAINNARSSIVCHTCGVKGHISRKCFQNKANSPGGTLYFRDLPASATEETVREMMKPFGAITSILLKSAVDGGKWAFVNLESRITGEKAIAELHELPMKGRDITVKWSDEGMWNCRDPTCNKRNHDYMDICVQCKLPKTAAKTVQAKA